MKILLDPKIPLPLLRNVSGYLCYHLWIAQVLRAIKQFNPKKRLVTEAEKMLHQARSEKQVVEQTGHPTPLVSGRRAQNCTQGSSGEQHRAPPHQILYIDNLPQRLCPLCSQPCPIHPSRSCGVEPTLCCCWGHSCLILLSLERSGQDSPWRGRTCPKTQWEMKSTNEMFLWTHLKVLWLRQPEKANQQMSDKSLDVTIVKIGEIQRQQIKNNFHWVPGVCQFLYW